MREVKGEGEGEGGSKEDPARLHPPGGAFFSLPGLSYRLPKEERQKYQCTFTRANRAELEGIHHSLLIPSNEDKLGRASTADYF